MSAPGHQHTPRLATSDSDANGADHGGHSMWLMVLCCIPMAIALVLIVVGR